MKSNRNKILKLALIIIIAFLFIQSTYAFEYRTAEDMNQMAIDRCNAVVSKEPEMVCLGGFTITYYCNCPICCGKWAYGACKDGSMPIDNYTVAVDTNIIALGTYLKIGDYEYTYKACDTGNAIIGNKIDIYCSNHNECLEHGKQENIKVYKIIE